MDAVTRGHRQLETVAAAQVIAHDVQQLFVGVRQIDPEDLLLLLGTGKSYLDLGLESGEDVFGNLIGGRVVVHGHRGAKIGVRLDLDSRDDRFHVAPRVEQGSQGSPALLAHAVALVENANASAQHGRRQRRSMVADHLTGADDRSHQEVLGAGIHRALKDVNLVAELLGHGVGQGRLAHAGLTQDAGRQGYLLRRAFARHQPAGAKLVLCRFGSHR